MFKTCPWVQCATLLLLSRAAWWKYVKTRRGDQRMVFFLTWWYWMRSFGFGVFVSWMPTTSYNLIFNCNVSWIVPLGFLEGNKITLPGILSPFLQPNFVVLDCFGVSNPFQTFPRRLCFFRSHARFPIEPRLRLLAARRHSRPKATGVLAEMDRADHKTTAAPFLDHFNWSSMGELGDR